MNISVKPYGSNLCYCRPDTTWERENKDFYSPECVNEIYWTPVVFARICKAGKCISEKFVERYYDAFNFGALMYCSIEEAIIGSAKSIIVLTVLPVSISYCFFFIFCCLLLFYCVELYNIIYLYVN